jgi:hypothetical protein
LSRSQGDWNAPAQNQVKFASQIEMTRLLLMFTVLGYSATAQYYVSGRVYLDKNGDGDMDGFDVPQATVRINVFRDVDGDLYGTTGTGAGAGNTNAFSSINKSTGAATKMADFSGSGTDFEACECLSGSSLSLESCRSPLWNSLPMPYPIEGFNFNGKQLRNT